jgi:hypothetical protein
LLIDGKLLSFTLGKSFADTFLDTFIMSLCN